MEQHRLIKWLKFLVIFAAGCGMVMDLGVLPGVGSWMVDLAPEFGGYFWPWLIFLCAIKSEVAPACTALMA